MEKGVDDAVSQCVGQALVQPQSGAETFIVSFDGSDDPANPLNWPKRRKWFVVGLLSAMTLVVYFLYDILRFCVLKSLRNLATLMCAPAAPPMLRDLSSSGHIYQTLLVSIWELGEAFGPLLIGPISEIYGRSPVYNMMNVSFCAFSMACALSRNIQMLIALRFLNGMAVASIVLNPPIVGDMFPTEERGAAMSIMGLAPLLGPVLGPIMGGYLAQAVGWRWIFGLAAVLAAALECAFLVFFRETYKVRIIERKAKELRRRTGDGRYQSMHHTEQTARRLLATSLLRPGRMLISSPIVTFLSIYISMVFGYTYILFTTITEVFQSEYRFSTSSASLTFLGLG
ncbi:MAG: hypothetical protein Q9213_007966 [Squamulea squamosa]